MNTATPFNIFPLKSWVTFKVASIDSGIEYNDNAEYPFYWPTIYNSNSGVVARMYFNRFAWNKTEERRHFRGVTAAFQQ